VFIYRQPTAKTTKKPKAQECTSIPINMKKKGDQSSHQGSPPRDGYPKPKPWIAKPDMFYVHYPGQTLPSFETVKAVIATKLQDREGEYVDAATSIQDMEVVNLSYERPSCQRSVASDPDQREFEQRLFEKEYEIDLIAHKTREATLRRNLKAAYAIILDEFTSRTIRDRIKNLQDLPTFEGDPIELLAWIRAQMEYTQRAQYEVITDVNLMRKYFLHMEGEDREDRRLFKTLQATTRCTLP